MEKQPLGVVVKDLSAILERLEYPPGEGETEAVAHALLNAAVEYADQTTKRLQGKGFREKHDSIFEELKKQIAAHLREI